MPRQIHATSLINTYKTFLRRRGLAPEYHVLKASAVLRQLSVGVDLLDDVMLRAQTTTNKSLRSTYRIFTEFILKQGKFELVNDIPDLSSIRRSMWRKHRTQMKAVRSVDMPLIKTSQLFKISEQFDLADQVIFALLAFQGLRREDFSLLKWNHVDFKGNTITVNGEKVHLFRTVKRVLIAGYKKGLLSTAGILISNYSPRMVDRVAKAAAEYAGLDPRLVSSRDWRYNALRIMVKKADLKFVISTFRIKLLSELPDIDRFKTCEF